MTLNGRKAPLAETIVLWSHHKNFNEDKLMLSAAKCRPAIVVSKNVRYMRTCIAYSHKSTEITRRMKANLTSIVRGHRYVNIVTGVWKAVLL